MSQTLPILACYALQKHLNKELCILEIHLEFYEIRLSVLILLFIAISIHTLRSNCNFLTYLYNNRFTKQRSATGSSNFRILLAYYNRVERGKEIRVIEVANNTNSLRNGGTRQGRVHVGTTSTPTDFNNHSRSTLETDTIERI